MLCAAAVAQVYVSVYAEGPTRILCFGEEKMDLTSVNDENSVPNLVDRCEKGGGEGGVQGVYLSAGR